MVTCIQIDEGNTTAPRSERVSKSSRVSFDAEHGYQSPIEADMPCTITPGFGPPKLSVNTAFAGSLLIITQHYAKYTVQHHQQKGNRMGQLIDGAWSTQWYDTKSTGGKFKRSESAFRNWVTADGSAGPTGEGGFKAESGRYHLYVSYACPWAHRTLLYRALKDLQDHISVSVVSPKMPDETGWAFTGELGSDKDMLNGADYLWQVYLKANPDYTGRVTVPVLWDKQTDTIVSNESADIIRMFNSAFNGVTGNNLDFYPQEKREEIDRLNARIYDDINNGVYKAGFATTQEAYSEAVSKLFDALDWVEGILTQRPFLTGAAPTEADWRLVTTLMRFDAVYVGHFKCNIRRIADYPHLSKYLKTLCEWRGVADTIHMDHIKTHYYWSHTTINPHRIIPEGPELDFLK
jgi:putative glutathione S-transferase